MDYIANHPDHGNSLEYGDEETLEGANKNLIWAYENTGDNNIFGKKLGIKVKIQTLLSGYRATEGNFGLQILISGTKEDADHEATKDVKEIVYFTNDNMYGNPYNYLLPTEQQLILDISSYKAIDSIYIAFWQRFTQSGEKQYVGSFKDIYGDLIPYIDENLATTGLAEVPANIKLSDLEVYVGMGIDEIENDELFIYTYDSLKYAAGDLEKTLHLSWAQYDKVAKTATVVDATDELYEYDAKIYWYIHDPTWTPEIPEYDSGVASHRFGGLFWRPMPLYEDEMTITLEMDVNKSNTRLKAVVHHDGTYLSSDVVRFNNKVDVEGLAEDLARNDQFILRCATYTVDPDLGEKTLYVDDAIGNFYVYDENNNILANDNNELYSDVTYYLEIWAKTHTEDGAETYVRLSDYADDNGWYEPYSVEWQFPERETMISQFNFINRGEAYYPMRSDEQFERDFASTRSFRVSQTYNMRYADNTIIAVIQRAGQAITIKKTLYFGRAAALGCEYTPVITIDSPEGNYYIDTNSTYEISCTVYDRRGQVIEAGMRPECSFEWKFYGTSNKPTYYYTENKDGFAGNVIKGRLFVCEPFVVEVTVNGAADYPLTVRRGVMVCNDSRFIQEHDIQCPDRIEFRSDGQSPKYFKNPFTVTTVGLDEKDKYLYPDWYINNEKILKLLEQPVENQTYIAQSGNSVTGGAHTEYAIGFAGPKVFGAALGDDTYAQQWTDNLLSDEYFTYIYFTYGTATVAQAIAFDKNTYASSLVNEWDGQSLSLDEENGAVIAKMIAAGTKDKKNRFTGVMMGDWSEKGDESLDVTGLYGFQAGSQTFAFKQDGTGFIGPSGKGRIHFDGRNALISNSDKSCYLNLNPVMVKKYLDEAGDFTEDEIWDLKNESGYSQYFLYCQVPKKENTEDAWTIADFNEETGEYIDKTWAKSFINPDEDSEQAKYDFFLVDPNNGVITSGGIYARFGVLGKKYPWIISDSGLTQKNFYGTIFLGNPEYVKNSKVFHYSHISDIEPGYTKNGEEQFETGMYSMVFTDENNRVHTALRSDGYLFTEYATIGNWYINDYEIYLPVENKAFRKLYQTTISEADSRPAYCLDVINLDAKAGIMTFNQGHLLIDGKQGLMGFNKDSYFTNDQYTMMLDFKKGLINFAKLINETEPRAQIDGANGIAYFAKRNIVLSGENATMYLGSQVTVNNTVVSTQTQGTIYLGQIKIWGISADEAGAGTINIPSIGTGGTSNFSIPTDDILPFDFALTDNIEDEDNVSANGELENWTPDPYNTISYSTSGGGTVQNNGICYIGYVDGKFAINDQPSITGSGLSISVGSQGNDSAIVLQPAGSTTTGYLAGDWNLNATNIKVAKIIMDEGYIKYETNYVAIASQLWVYQKVADPLWSRIVDVNNLAAQALNKAYYGINQANRALKQAIKSITFSTNGSIGAQVGLILTATTVGGDSVVTGANAGSVTVAGIYHAHKILVGVPDGSISIIKGVTDAGEKSSWNHSHTIKCTPSGGQITIEIQNSMSSGNSSDSFNIADTQYYKDALELSAGSFNESGKTLEVTNKNSDTITPIDASAAYAAGWADAIATLTISVDTTSKTVTATVGDDAAGSNTKSKTYKLGANGTSHSGTWYSGITAIAPGVWNSTDEISNPYTSIYGTISWS